MAGTNTLEGILVGLLVALFALIFVVAAYFARRMTVDVLRPVESLHRAVLRVREGKLEHRVSLLSSRRSTELTDLGEAFNSMADALDKSHQDLSHQARHDVLTGLLNRAAFEKELHRRFRPGDQRQPEGLSVLFIDVDDFKLVNDSLGHAAGDAVLI